MSLVSIPFKVTPELHSQIHLFANLNFNGNRSEFLRIAVESYIGGAEQASLPASFIDALAFVLEILKTDTPSEKSWLLLRNEVVRLCQIINHLA